MDSIKKIWLWIKNWLFTSDEPLIEKVLVPPAPNAEVTQQSDVARASKFYAPGTTTVRNTGSVINTYNDDPFKKRRDAEEEYRRRTDEDDTLNNAMTLALLASLASSNTDSDYRVKEPKFESGRGGDYAGAGASGSWDSPTKIESVQVAYSQPEERAETTSYNSNTGSSDNYSSPDTSSNDTYSPD